MRLHSAPNEVFKILMSRIYESTRQDHCLPRNQHSWTTVLTLDGRSQQREIDLNSDCTLHSEGRLPQMKSEPSSHSHSLLFAQVELHPPPLIVRASLSWGAQDLPRPQAMCRPVLFSSWVRWILYLPFLTSKAIPLVRESAARDLNVTPSGVFTSVESLRTILPSIRLSEPPLALLTGNGQHLLTSSTIAFTSTIAVVTTNANGGVTTSSEVITGILTTLVPLPAATQSPVLGPNAHSPINPGVIAGPIVATIAVLGIVLWVILRRRKAVLRAQVLSEELIPSEDLIPSKDRPASAQRDTLQTETDLSAPHASWEPYLDLSLQPSDSTLTPSSTISTRQLYISSQVNRAQEKVRELEELSSLLCTASVSGTDYDVPRTVLNAVEEISPASGAGGPESIEAKLQRAVEQIEALNSRIQEMERQRRSSWALGRSDDPPPGYTA
ncbi:hypothetical protein B0H11DRAFT_1965021 [Mycena galericulata]|nr:hypothetical protein B0H11DRAFT_1965021 [Mycena galericulata]